MIALAGFLARLLPAFAQYFMWSFRLWHLAAFAGFVGLVVIFLDKILLVMAAVGGQLLRWAVVVGARILIYLVSALPSVPEDFGTVAWGSVMSFMGPANRYVPIDVAFQYAGMIAAVYAAMLVWKLVKFIRGGG